MNKSDFKYIKLYLDQLSQRIDSAINELNLLQKHAVDFNVLFKNIESTEKNKDIIPLNTLNIEAPNKTEKCSTDLIRIKEVMQMTGTSRSFIYAHIKAGDFPRPVHLSSRSIAWVRSSVEKWIQSKVNNV